MMEPEDRDRLVRMETKLDVLLLTKDDHESRIRKLEERKWPLPSIAAIVAVLSLGIALWNATMGG